MDMIGFLFVDIHSKMQGAVAVALTVAFTRTHHLANASHSKGCDAPAGRVVIRNLIPRAHWLEILDCAFAMSAAS